LRHWYDLVLARRWSGIDGLRALASDSTLDGASRWLAATGLWIIGDEHARDLLTDLAETLLEPVGVSLPRLAQIVAREMVELLSHPWSTRWSHLRCAAARDHASASIRQWLHAAAEERFFEGPATDPAMTSGELGELGPETSRAAAAATEARGVRGDFLLDWFVSDREARSAVDEWARATLRLYHRLRGAVLLDGALRAARGGAR
jgi:hypothetical protein